MRQRETLGFPRVVFLNDVCEMLWPVGFSLSCLYSVWSLSTGYVCTFLRGIMFASCILPLCFVYLKWLNRDTPVSKYHHVNVCARARVRVRVCACVCVCV